MALFFPFPAVFKEGYAVCNKEYDVKPAKAPCSEGNVDHTTSKGSLADDKYVFACNYHETHCRPVSAGACWHNSISFGGAGSKLQQERIWPNLPYLEQPGAPLD